MTKSYDMRPNRARECPTGAHEPWGTGGPDECTCAWLIISSQVNGVTEGTIHFSRRELETLIREADAGFFDPADYPMRRTSMFISPHIQALIDVAERDPALAAVRLLIRAQWHAVAYDEKTHCLSLLLEDGWYQVWLPEHETDTAEILYETSPGGEAPQEIWRRPTTIDGFVVDPQTAADMRAQIRAATGAPEIDWRAYAPDEQRPTNPDGDKDKREES